MGTKKNFSQKNFYKLSRKSKFIFCYLYRTNFRLLENKQNLFELIYNNYSQKNFINKKKKCLL